MITCMIIDDEPLAVDLLRDYVAKTPFLDLVHAGTDPLKGMELLLRQPPDLLFLDIQMPEITGLQLMKIIGSRTRVIFTTAYGEHALDGFEHNAIDYLLKPIYFDRFYLGALKAKDAIEKTAAPQPAATATAAVATDYIFVKADARMVKVFVSDMLFIEGLKDYIAIHTPAEKLIVLDNLKDIHAGLPAARFARVHKSFIVALDKIDSIERSRIFIGAHSIPIGDSYRDGFFGMLKGKQFGGR